MAWKHPNKIWFCPAFIHQCCVELVQNKGIEQLKKERKYKKLIESYDLSLTALAIYALNKKTHELPLVQVSKQDPPDGYIGQESKERLGDFDISTIELTRYDAKNGQTLLQQLLSSDKINSKYTKYGEQYVLLVKVEDGIEPNYQEVNQFLIKHQIKFAVWALQIIQTTPDTIVSLTVLNLDIQIGYINVGEIAFLYKQNKVPNVLELKRTGSKEKVRKEINNQIDKKYLNKDFGWLE